MFKWFMQLFKNDLTDDQKLFKKIKLKIQGSRYDPIYFTSENNQEIISVEIKKFIDTYQKMFNMLSNNEKNDCLEIAHNRTLHLLDHIKFQKIKQYKKLEKNFSEDFLKFWNDYAECCKNISSLDENIKLNIASLTLKTIIMS
jgi:hypothetical protein